MASTTEPSLLILGTDTVLGAAPCSAVQLTHACLAAGFDAVVPASWGDELVAARVLEKLKVTSGPAVQCSCPRVAERLAPNADAIAPMMLCTVSPPVATAEYLRALYAPVRPKITFAGGCTGGAGGAIDTWISAADLFQSLSSRGISVARQPTEFDALPPDRRRFHSEPGGLPTRASLRQMAPPRSSVELTDANFVASLGQLLLGDEPVLVDIAPCIGCSCAGATGATMPVVARARVREHEPPRAPGPVVDHALRINIDAEAPRPRDAAPAKRTTPTVPIEATGTAPALAAVAVEAPRRRSPPGMPRPVLGTSPRSSRGEGRPLPRAYVARRRSSPRGMKSIEPPRDSKAVVTPSRLNYVWLGAGLLGGAVLTILATLLL